MDLKHSFRNKSSATVPEMLGISPAAGHDHLVVSTIDLEDTARLAAYGSRAVKIIPLNDSSNAEDTLNGIARWLRASGAMDQRAHHGDNRAAYSVSFFKIAEGAIYPSRLCEFYLDDYLFADKNRNDVQGFDDLMRMMDRDNMGKAMLSGLVDDFGLAAPQISRPAWIHDLRSASHPDHRAAGAVATRPRADFV